MKPLLLLLALGLVVHVVAAGDDGDDDYYDYYEYYALDEEPDEPAAEAEPADAVKLEPSAESELEASPEGSKATVYPEDEGTEARAEQTEPEGSETPMTEAGDEETKEEETTDEPSTYMKEETPTKAEPGEYVFFKTFLEHCKGRGLDQGISWVKDPARSLDVWVIKQSYTRRS